MTLPYWLSFQTKTQSQQTNTVLQVLPTFPSGARTIISPLNVTTTKELILTTTDTQLLMKPYTLTTSQWRLWTVSDTWGSHLTIKWTSIDTPQTSLNAASREPTSSVNSGPCSINHPSCFFCTAASLSPSFCNVQPAISPCYPSITKTNFSESLTHAQT